MKFEIAASASSSGVRRAATRATRFVITFGTFFQTDSFPYLNLTDPRTFVPGAPLTAYAGLRARW
jgi:hypothetical protein